MKSNDFIYLDINNDLQDNCPRTNFPLEYIFLQFWGILSDSKYRLEIFSRGGHYNKMAYDEFYSICFACSQMCLILFYFVLPVVKCV